MDMPTSDAQLHSDPYAWIPFAAAILIALTSRLTNQLWTGIYDKYYSDLYANPNPTKGQLRYGAEWAVDVSTSLPSYFLTLVGVVLLNPNVPPQILGVLCLGVLLLLMFFTLMAARRQSLTAVKRTGWRYYSPLAYMQMALNLLGLLLFALK